MVTHYSSHTFLNNFYRSPRSRRCFWLPCELQSFSILALPALGAEVLFEFHAQQASFIYLIEREIEWEEAGIFKDAVLSAHLML